MTALKQLAFDWSVLNSAQRRTVDFRTPMVRDELFKLSDLVRTTASTIWKLGDHLMVVQEALAPSGQFLAWLANEFPTISKSTVYNAINVRKQYDFPTVGNLDIGLKALYLLAQPSTPEEARIEVIERIGQGEEVTHATAKAIVQAHKPAPTVPSPVTISPLPDEMTAQVESLGFRVVRTAWEASTHQPLYVLCSVADPSQEIPRTLRGVQNLIEMETLRQKRDTPTAPPPSPVAGIVDGIRSAVLAGDWFRAQTGARALGAAERATWEETIAIARKADTALRQHDSLAAWLALIRVGDTTLRQRMMQGYEAACLELDLEWPPIPTLPEDLFLSGEWQLFRADDNGALWARHDSGISERYEDGESLDALWERCRQSERAITTLTAGGWIVRYDIDQQCWAAGRLGVVLNAPSIAELAALADEELSPYEEQILAAHPLTSTEVTTFVRMALEEMARAHPHILQVLALTLSDWTPTDYRSAPAALADAVGARAEKSERQADIRTIIRRKQ